VRRTVLYAIGDGASAIGKFAPELGRGGRGRHRRWPLSGRGALFGGPSIMDLTEEAKRRAAADD
jgi:hypothetical protein